MKAFSFVNWNLIKRNQWLVTYFYCKYFICHLSKWCYKYIRGIVSKTELKKQTLYRTKLALHQRIRGVTHHQVSSKSLVFHWKHYAMPIISVETVSGEWAACVLESICHSVLVSGLKCVTYACHGCPGCLSDQPWGDSDASCLSSSLAQKNCHLSTHTHIHTELSSQTNTTGHILQHELVKFVCIEPTNV